MYVAVHHSSQYSWASKVLALKLVQMLIGVQTGCDQSQELECLGPRPEKLEVVEPALVG